MLKKLAIVFAVVVAIIAALLLVFRTPDTDPAEMRAKYGAAPSQFVDIGGGQIIHLRDEGPRDAPIIILLHGSNSDLHTWQPWVERLATAYRIIRFDQIGHGLTGPAVDGDYSRTAFADDVEAIAQRLGLSRFVLAGNSMGGGIAVEYARIHPERLSGLVLVDAAGAPNDEKSEGNFAFTVARIPVVNSLLASVMPRSLIANSLSASVSNQDVVTPGAIDRYWELARIPGNRAATLARFGQSNTPFKQGQLTAVTVPTLVMWGEEDSLIPFSSADWFTRALPNATIVSYPGIGHLPMEEAPDASAADVRKWLVNNAFTTR